MTTKFRRDINGLRAISVASVVLYHAARDVLPGGFVGVDVFFVISGYLITGIIYSEIRSNDFSITRFYERRARRILPALLFLLGAAALAGFIFMPATEYTDLSRAITAAALFAANIFYWGEVNYFAVAAEDQPLLHTWSLGVEEQFYIIWPIALWLSFSLTRERGVLWLLVLTTLASLALSVWASPRHVSSSFYLLSARGWELGAGAIIAVIGKYVTSRLWATLTQLLGLGCIAAALLLLDGSYAYPGYVALLPVLGAACVIVARNDRTPLARLLGSGPFHLTGLTSYSWYLWHWPIFSFSQIYLNGPLETWQLAAAIVASYAIAVLSYRFIETPFRKPSTQPAAPRSAGFAGFGRLVFGQPLVNAALSIAVLASVGGLITTTHGLPQRLPHEVRDVEEGAAPLASEHGCITKADGDLGDCIPEDAAFSVVVVGDSHAHHFLPAIEAAAARLDGVALLRHQPDCAYLDGLTITNRYGAANDQCNQFHRDLRRQIEAAGNRLDIVVLAARWSQYGNDAETLIDGFKPRLSLPEFEQHLRQTVMHLLDNGYSVVLAAEVPFFRNDPLRCVARALLHHQRPTACEIQEDEVRRIQDPATNVLRRLAGEFKRVEIVSTRSLFCHEGRCSPMLGQRIAYFDNDHVNSQGILPATGAFVEAFANLMRDSN